MRKSYPPSRRDRVLKIRRRLERESFPRLQMGLIVMLTGLTGLLSSFLMLLAGIDDMVVRYPLAVGCAYLVFLLLLWLWLRTHAADWIDILAHVDDPMPARGRAPNAGAEPGSGDATVSLSDELEATDMAIESLQEVVVAADEFAIPFAVLLVLVGMALASCYVVWIAPVLFAELVVDGTLSLLLYRRLRKQPDRHWLESALRRTWLPFLLTAVFFALVAMAMGRVAPGARSLGEAVHKSPAVGVADR